MHGGNAHDVWWIAIIIAFWRTGAALPGREMTGLIQFLLVRTSMQVLKEMQGLYTATLATIFVAVQQIFYQVTMFHSFMVFNVMFCCDIILEFSYIQRY